MGNLPNGNYVVPYLVALMKQPTAGDVHELLKTKYFQTKTSNTHRYLQIWKDRQWLQLARDTHRWSATKLGLESLQRRAVNEGWPEWLTSLGYSPDQMEYHERPAIRDGFEPVDPNIFNKPST